MYFLVLFYIEILIKNNKILIIIQRSAGDVFLSLSLVNRLYEYFQSPQIDLLVNEDTLAVAQLFPNINYIHTFSYQNKKDKRWLQEKKIIVNLYRKYDLSINLTASDRSVIYGLLAAKKTISAIEKDNYKSWWKKLLLSDYYYFDLSKHILLNNLESLKLLKINHQSILQSPIFSEEDKKKVSGKLEKLGISEFIIFHPSTQYNYKIYPKKLRDKLLGYLNNLGIPIVITGSNKLIDLNIQKELPSLSNLYNFIGETSLKEYCILSQLSIAYIGMDTLNMHIAASQNKRIFAIFGPTNLKMWSPWSNVIESAASENIPIQTYANITIFQANLPCVACGKAGCDDNHGHSDCLDNIDPKTIFNNIEDWYLSLKDKSEIQIFTETKIKPRKILLYIVYGEDQTYYDGAIFSFLTFKYWLISSDQIEIFVLTEKPEKFAGYPINILAMNSKQKNEWSLNGAYHFRIKNRGLAFVMDKLKLNERDKILFFDTDTYFHKSPMPLFDLIQSNQALFYLNEGLIYTRKRFFTYVENLEGKKIEIDGENYELSRKSALWGSLMIGITGNMRSSLEQADKLMLKLFEIVPSHTIEPFSLSETLLKKYKIVEGKNFVSLYSTSRKKQYAKNILSKFLKENMNLDIDKKVRLAQTIKIKRPLFIIIKQRLIRIISR